MSTAVLRRSVAQVFMVGIPGPVLDSDARAFLHEYTPPGVYSCRKARASESRTGPGIPTMNTWATDRRRTAVDMSDGSYSTRFAVDTTRGRCYVARRNP